MSVHWPNVKEALEKANTFGVSRKYEQWELLCFAAIHGYPGRFLDLFEWVRVSDLTYHIKTSMLLGKTLIHISEGFLFGCPLTPSDCYKATQFQEFYYKQSEACREAVNTWSCCAIQLGVCKDLRIVIAKLIWASKNDTLYVK